MRGTCLPSWAFVSAALVVAPLAFAQMPAAVTLPASSTSQSGTSPIRFRQAANPTRTSSAAAEAGERLMPINLATALQLANARPIDVQIAGRQVSLAAKQLQKANLLWVPNIVMGADFFRHEGGQQNFAGEIVRSNRSTTGVGFGPNVVFSAADAYFAPLAAHQDLRARVASRQAAENDVVLAVAEAYFNVQQARGELAGAILAAEKAQEVAGRAEKLGETLAPPLEATRARVELARRQQAASAARERWRTASAELVRLLRLEPGTLVEPLEPPFLPVTVINQTETLDNLIGIGLTTRPELQGQSAIVQATLTRLKQEKLRPLIPSLALRSASTNPAGSIGIGGFGGGTGSSTANWGSRFDIDVQVLWEFSALGFGNRVRVGERRVEHQTATLELFRIQDHVAAEVAQAHAQVKGAAERLFVAEPALRDALELTEKSLQGMSQTRLVGEINTLVVRPQEVVAAVQSLSQANADYYAAISDYNRSQFRLYRALGHPAQCLAGVVPGPGETETASPKGPAMSRPTIMIETPSAATTPPMPTYQGFTVLPRNPPAAPTPPPAPIEVPAVPFSR